ncbi:hypothetical protein KIH39_12155 [Telmatocola sphagniphila]|uniref:DUF4034 domain-containing protein n=1 Tax=Telmatocola sphagniphila TaxID=1123043 RepID=A0A8E6BCF8_9BACT|nr:hypothetical protein [Telmatocola sphagniphila]QVL34623.1 hypothetical protein KIH39_12155 [Telmatocola sphagniphila]
MSWLLRKRFLKWFLITLFVVLASTAFEIFYSRHVIFKESQAAYDEITKHLDETDPGWRWEDLLAARKDVPDEKNCYTLQKEIMAIYPRKFDVAKGFARDNFDLENGLVDHHAPEPERYRTLPAPLPFEVLDWAGGYLGNREKAIQLARAMADRPEGRHPIQYNYDLLETNIQTVSDTRAINFFLEWDVRIQVHNRRFELAVRDMKAIHNLARSNEQDPLIICMLIRLALNVRQAQLTQEILAEATSKDADLRTIQNLFEEDLTENIFAQALRFERGFIWTMLRRIAEQDESANNRIKSLPLEGFAGLNYRPYSLGDQARLLEVFENCLDISNLPIDLVFDNANKYSEWFDSVVTKKTDYNRMRFLLTRVYAPNFKRLAFAYLRWIAQLRTAIIGVACERYRLTKGKWPENLDDLVPQFLSESFEDPFTGQPMVYKKVVDGIILYSVGENQIDDGGDVLPKVEKKLSDPSPENANVINPTDIGFRLWNPELRGKAPSK